VKFRGLGRLAVAYNLVEAMTEVDRLHLVSQIEDARDLITEVLDGIDTEDEHTLIRLKAALAVLES
jgi:hypothetical protein